MLLKLQQPPKAVLLQKERIAFVEVLQKAVKANSGLLAFGD